jgi:hypothetical protein
VLSRTVGPFLNPLSPPRLKVRHTSP